MKYDKVRKSPSQLLSLTGFTTEEFEALIPTFEYHRNEYYSCFTLKGKPRRRISYNRKSSQFPLIRDKLLFILSYLKNTSPAGISRCDLWDDPASMQRIMDPPFVGYTAQVS
jgi:hypothetical protein